NLSLSDVKFYCCGFKTDPGRKRAEKRIFFFNIQQGIDCLSIQKLEIRGPGHINICEPADNLIKALSSKKMSTAFVLSPGMLDSFDDLIAVLPEPVHFYNLLRRMLQIAVDDYAAVSGRIEKTGIYGGFLAKVSG